jgi:undecaprenyl diphosphate synthase
MDGNGRWAKKRGMPRTAGHKAGAEVFRNIATYCQSIGVEYLTVYAFSTENWKRPTDEVSVIMGLLEKYLRESVDEMRKKGVRLKVFGDVSMLSDEIQQLITETDDISSQIQGMQANICINYGGRSEILRAAQQYAGMYKDDGTELTEELFSSLMYSGGIPDPDLVIRPSGELRLSNFMLWQCAYSEFYFTDVLWPDFDEHELNRAIAAYQKRDRRYGGIKK